MNYEKYKIAYVVADLKRVGPTNQTLNIVRYSGAINNCILFTLFKESNDTQIHEYTSSGIKVICLNLTRKNIFIKGVSTLKRALIEANIDIVHSWGTFADIFTYYATKKINVKHIITLRCFPKEDMPTRMNYLLGMILAELDLHILKNSKYVVACSKSLKKKMQDAYGWHNITSIQNGVDFNKFKQRNREESRKQLGVQNNDIVFVAAGSMIPRKRIDETAKAFLSSNKKHNMKLWFLGDGALLSEMKEKYEHDGIVFFGKQSEVSKFLSASDVFISSSESEGMPNAVLEAISCNLPVYLSNIPQHMEVFDEVPGCGKSYTLGNVTELSRLIENTTIDDLEIMKKQTEQLKISAFTMENMGKKYERYYEKVINER